MRNLSPPAAGEDAVKQCFYAASPGTINMSVLVKPTDNAVAGTEL